MEAVIYRIRSLEILRNVQTKVEAVIQVCRRHRHNGSLVRTIAYYVPFLPPTPRISFDNWGNGVQIRARSLSNSVFGSIMKCFHNRPADSDTEDSEDGEQGLIYAFGPDNLSDDDSRTESVCSSIWGGTETTLDFEGE